MSEKIKIRENVLDSSPGEKSVAKTIIHNEKTYYCHPLYDNYGASKDGHIINRKRLIPRKGRLHLTGYLQTTVHNKNREKKYQSHRFIWESIKQQIIPVGYEIHHINNDKQDNSIDNLKLVTRQQNMIYDGKIRLGKQKSKKQNVPMKCEKFYYHHIYTNFGANKYGQIYNKKTKRCSIGNLQLNCYFNITLNQIGLPSKKVLVHRCVYECYNGNISDKLQINHIDSNRQNNCINNLELVTQSENAKHAHEARKYKTTIEIKTEKPIKSIKMDIELEESDDEFTEDEKQKIDKKYNAMINKINNGNFTKKQRLRKTFDYKKLR